MPNKTASALKGISYFILAVFASLATFVVRIQILQIPDSLRIILSIAFFIWGLSQLAKGFEDVIQ